MYFQFTKKPYIAIIGDIRNSKKIIDQKNAQQLFQEVVLDVNQEYKENIASNFMLTLGMSSRDCFLVVKMFSLLFQ